MTYPVYCSECGKQLSDIEKLNDFLGKPICDGCIEDE